MLFLSIFPVLCMLVHVSALPMTTLLAKRQIKQPLPHQCELKWFVPEGIWQWQHYNQAIISGHHRDMIVKGPNTGEYEHVTEVAQSPTIQGKGPPRHFRALFRGKNWTMAPNAFQLYEFYDSGQIRPTTPDLSESYYVVKFTDSGGHGYNGGFMIHMPEAKAYETKFCQFQIDDKNDQQRTSTINQYVHPLILN